MIKCKKKKKESLQDDVSDKTVEPHIEGKLLLGKCCYYDYGIVDQYMQSKGYICID